MELTPIPKFSMSKMEKILTLIHRLADLTGFRTGT